jgi:hypothetical protein
MAELEQVREKEVGGSTRDVTGDTEHNLYNALWDHCKSFQFCAFIFVSDHPPQLPYRSKSSHWRLLTELP